MQRFIYLVPAFEGFAILSTSTISNRYIEARGHIFKSHIRGLLTHIEVLFNVKFQPTDAAESLGVKELSAIKYDNTICDGQFLEYFQSQVDKLSEEFLELGKLLNK